MLKLIKREESYVNGYKEYCKEFYDNKVTYFCPTNPKSIDENWYQRSKEWYDKKELGQLEGQPKTLHFWAVDGNRFIGEFQLRTELTEDIMNGIGSIGYSVRITEQRKGYGQKILKQGLDIAKKNGLDKVLLNINELNEQSIYVVEKLGGKLMDKIQSYNKAEGNHLMRRYWIYL
ncbi:GNAT family N-acetyltransferase [Sedimentibacter sp. zth1]|uniref:GNAT family N-acetyltransferase n=1 Tax=Sedimentibacter sp. zth1 TaxID=2816908 RepID=UPI001A928E15|nr:GNAT family N-acetyltransferase [Sedimentibacter sp. zth1]QSX06651.1 GNAT family N-acetyltransferase [Sedimentibacter sp. zth1]